MGTNNPLYLAKRHYERALEILPAFNLESDSAVHDTPSILTYIALLASHLKEGAERVSDYVEAQGEQGASDERIYKIYEANQKIRVIIEYIRQTVCPHIAENDLEIPSIKPVSLERDFPGLYQAKARVDVVLKLINPLLDA